MAAENKRTFKHKKGVDGVRTKRDVDSFTKGGGQGGSHLRGDVAVSLEGVVRSVMVDRGCAQTILTL